MTTYVGAIDQGTTSTRFMIFDHAGDDRGASPSSSTSRSCRGPGWVEHDPVEIWARTREVDRRARSTRPGSTQRDLAAVGITNQRETTVRVGRRHRRAGAPTRSSGRTRRTDKLAARARRAPRPDRFREPRRPAAGDLLLRGRRSSWLLDNVDGAARARRGAARCCSARWTPG